jgi:hypothetical protein
MTTSTPLTMPRHDTLRETVMASVPQTVTQTTGAANQQGLQGVVAAHDRVVAGMVALQKLLATAAPDGVVKEKSRHVTFSSITLAGRPHTVPQAAGLTYQLYVLHSGVARHVTVGEGAGPTQ